MKKQDKIWLGVEDLTNESAYIERSKQEFFELPIVDALGESEEVIEEATAGSNRRDFLKYMGFSLTAATIAASCEIPVRKAIPYVVKPDAIVPGVAAYYASTYVRGGDYCPIVVKTREGRPIKIEGNTMSPITKGGTSARAQAAVLDLYDTARLRHAGSIEDGAVKKMSWADLDKKVGGELKPDANIRIVTNTVLSPTLKAAIEAFKAYYPNTQVVTYDAVSASGLLDANALCFGETNRVVPSYHFDKANVIVSFGADFLGTWISPVEYARQFAAARKITSVKEAKMARLICFENGMSLTGSNADNRVLIKPSEQGAAVVALCKELGGDVTVPKGLSAEAKKAIKTVAKDLKKNAGKSLVVSGSNDTNVQVVINQINELLGNYGATIDLGTPSYQRQGSDSAIQGLVKEMNGGGVDAVIVYDANPAYDLGNAEAFAKAFAKVKTRVSCAGLLNETAALCNYAAPTHHFLEDWGDAEAKKGEYTIIQPTISPLFDTRSFGETLLTWADNDVVKQSADTPYYVFLKKYWENNIFPSSGSLNFQMFWDNTVHDGYYSASSESNAPLYAGNAASAASKIKGANSSGLEVNFYETVNIGGGQYATNPWLMEMPDPITRCVWDNVLSIPIKWDGDNNYENYEEFAGLKDGDKVEVTIGDKTFTTVVMRTFGQMPGTVSIALGYGRTAAGLGNNVGNDVNGYIGSYGKGGNRKYFATGVQVSGKVGRDKEFACVQMHHTLGVTGELDGETINVDERILGSTGYQGSLTKRTIIRRTNLPELSEAVASLKEEREHAQYLNSKSMYPGYDKYYKQGHHWGMSIDLSACIGCGACQVACIAENNVPVVGKTEVHRHHEMTWLRIDRYFYGDVNNPNVVYQPMMCQHCDNAPCENVCPVAATNHSSEGLNQMTYNRCIGTRYCANNCPYKVRRFNWLDYTTADIFAWNEAPINGEEIPFGADNLTRMVLNPDVTVRSRGVIEKCSFCVQRLQEAKLTAKVEQRQLQDGDIKTACQSACPTDAIIFGDINDKSSAVVAGIESDLTYQVLEEVNTQPSVNYQMVVLNKNTELA